MACRVNHVAILTHRGPFCFLHMAGDTEIMHHPLPAASLMALRTFFNSVIIPLLVMTHDTLHPGLFMDLMRHLHRCDNTIRFLDSCSEIRLGNMLVDITNNYNIRRTWIDFSDTLRAAAKQEYEVARYAEYDPTLKHLLDHHKTPPQLII